MEGDALLGQSAGAVLHELRALTSQCTAEDHNVSPLYFDRTSEDFVALCQQASVRSRDAWPGREYEKLLPTPHLRWVS